MIDYSDCTKEELIELLERYAKRVLWRGSAFYKIYEPAEEEICDLLKEDGLKVKYVESEKE